MGVRDDELLRLRAFPAGVTNKLPETRLPTDENGGQLALTSAVNVDLDSAARPVIRQGHTTEIAAASHSLHPTPDGAYLLANTAGDLVAYDDSGAADVLALQATVQAGIGPRFVTFADVIDDVYWSNGVEIGRITADLQARPVWVDTPASPAVSVTANGGLAGGSYEVALTVLDGDGRESGASPAVVVALATGQGIALALPGAPVGAAKWRVYASPPDGEVLYHVADLPIAAASAQIGHGARGAALATAWLFPLLPCSILRPWNGRLLGASGNLLVWSEALRVGLMHADNYLRIGQEINLLEPVGEGTGGAGVFVSDHRRTYFLRGGNPKEWAQEVRYGHPAVPGTSLQVPGNVFGLETTGPVAFWLARNGTFCLGLPGGTVQPLREEQLGLPVDAEHGAAGYFEFEGIRQIVTTILAGSANGAVMGDRAAATIRRHGVEI